jgi:hypothetical protein
MSFDLSKLDLDKLKGDVTDAVVVGVSGLLEGAAEDLQTFGQTITENALEAKLLGRNDLVQACMDQIRAIAEANRIRLNGVSWDAVKQVISAIFEVVGSVALSVLL